MAQHSCQLGKGINVARPREFDEASVLDAAIQCFWVKGFEATSIRDLIDCMGITGASLYNAFGDKRALYRKALEHYLQNGLGERVTRLESTLAPRQAIEAFFDEIIERSMNDPQQRGCLMVNSALEAAPHNPDAQAVVDDFLSRAQAFFLRCVEAGQNDGTISRFQAAEDLASLLLNTLLGLRVLARARPQRALLESVVRPVLALLDTGIAPASLPPSVTESQR
jgi:TetR/AcrR family transcriptional regulator, transcriptional repressor for nem operon